MYVDNSAWEYISGNFAFHLQYQLILGTCMIFFRLSLTEAIFLDYMSQAFFSFSSKLASLSGKGVKTLIRQQFCKDDYFVFTFQVHHFRHLDSMQFYLDILSKLVSIMSFQTTMFSSSLLYYFDNKTNDMKCKCKWIFRTNRYY